MGNFSLAEALRYVTAGFVFLGGLWYHSPEAAKPLLKALGSLGVLGFCLAFGAVMYPVYRGLFYNRFIPRLQDLTRVRSHSYRTYLQQHFGITKKADAQRLYIALRDSKSELGQPLSRVSAAIANVHLGYMAGLILLGFTIASAVNDAKHWWVFFLLGAFVLAGTFAFERRLQSDEQDRLLCLCSNDQILETACQLGIECSEAAGS